MRRGNKEEKIHIQMIIILVNNLGSIHTKWHIIIAVR